MLRTALRPRWLAVLALVLLAATGMSLLGRWQLDRAKQHGAQEERRAATSQPARPLDQVILPRQTFPQNAVGVRVETTGTWDGARRLLVAGRELGGRNGFWVLVPLRLADGSAVGVVRGWVAAPSDPAAAAPAGQVRVTGLLQPTEAPVARDPGQGTGLPDGQLAAIAVTDLVAAWPYPLITGFVVAQTETTPDGAPLGGAIPQRLPPVSAQSGLDIRNVAYAIQWWLFAAFGVFMWWRLVRDDHLARSSPVSPVSPGRKGGPEPAASGDPPIGEDDSTAQSLARGVSP